MTVAEFTPIVFAAALCAGFLGSLTGLGGGVIVTPVLALFLGVDLRYAIGASLVSVIATSSGAAAAYVRDGYSNIRIGMFLEIATTLGQYSERFSARIFLRGISVYFLASFCCKLPGKQFVRRRTRIRRFRPTV